MKLDLLARLQAARTEKEPAVLVTRMNDGAQALWVSGKLAAGSKDLLKGNEGAIADAVRADRSCLSDDHQTFLHVFNPPLRLVVIGAVHIAQVLVPIAQLAGYEVIVIDPRRAWATEARFPGVKIDHDWPDEALKELHLDHRTALVTLTHDPKLDDPALIEALGSEVFYIGALGSTRTHAKRLGRLADAGFGERDFARIHGPIGLAIGAKSPSEIAISIMAQITQQLRGAPRSMKPESAA